MAKITFLGKWSKKLQRDISAPRGYLCIKYNDIYRENMAKFFDKLEAAQNNKISKLIEAGETVTDETAFRELKITIEYHYKKGSYDQIKLIWALYQIEANEQNAGIKGHKAQEVTKDELYHADLVDCYECGDFETIKTQYKLLGMYTEDYSFIPAVTYKENDYIIQELLKLEIPPDDTIEIHGVRGLSKRTTKELSEWVEMLFNRLAYNGVNITEPGDIQTYWLEWRDNLNKQKIVLYDSEIMTQAEYREKNPVCEACGKSILTGGELHHIKPFGMGGNRDEEPKKNYSDNWLHLCHKCHIEIFHGRGVAEFIKLYGHLKNKIESSLSREFDPITWGDMFPEEPEELEYF